LTLGRLHGIGPRTSFQKETFYKTVAFDPTRIVAITALRDLKNSGLRLYGIFSLLTKFQLANCLDDRDRLFAFFWHCKRCSGAQRNFSAPSGINQLRRHYTLSVVQVYLIFAQAALSTGLPFDTLHCAGAFRTIKTSNLSPEKQPLNL
jgi:hypothetical protein